MVPTNVYNLYAVYNHLCDSSDHQTIPCCARALSSGSATFLSADHDGTTSATFEVTLARLGYSRIVSKAS